MLGYVTWIFSLCCILGSSSVCFWRIPWLFGPRGFVERKYVLSVVWPVATKILDAATRKSAHSKNLRFLLNLDFSRISSSIPKMFLSWVHYSPSSMYILLILLFCADWLMSAFFLCELPHVLLSRRLQIKSIMHVGSRVLLYAKWHRIFIYMIIFGSKLWSRYPLTMMIY